MNLIWTHKWDLLIQTRNTMCFVTWSKKWHGSKIHPSHHGSNPAWWPSPFGIRSTPACVKISQVFSPKPAGLEWCYISYILSFQTFTLRVVRFWVCRGMSYPIHTLFISKFPTFHFCNDLPWNLKGAACYKGLVASWVSDTGGHPRQPAAPT